MGIQPSEKFSKIVQGKTSEFFLESLGGSQRKKALDKNPAVNREKEREEGAEAEGREGGGSGATQGGRIRREGKVLGAFSEFRPSLHANKVR